MCKKLYSLFLLFTFLFTGAVHSSDNWMLTRFTGQVADTCKRHKGIVKDYKFYKQDDKNCFEYTCSGFEKFKLISEAPVEFINGKRQPRSKKDVFEHKEFRDFGGRTCGLAEGEITPLKHELEKMKNLNYVRCYRPCSKDFTSKKCYKCLERHDELLNCKVSNDGLYIECPNATYKRTESIFSDARKIEKKIKKDAKRKKKDSATSIQK